MQGFVIFDYAPVRGCWAVWRDGSAMDVAYSETILNGIEHAPGRSPVSIAARIPASG
jgi:hypothetical protein